MRAWSEQRTPRGPWAEVHTKVGPACAGVPEDPEEYAKPRISALRLNKNGPKTRLHHEDMWLHKDGLKDVNAWWRLGSQGFKNVNACLCSVTVGKGKDQLRSKLENIMSKCINFGLNDPCARLWSDSRRVRKGNRELSSLPLTDSVNQTAQVSEKALTLVIVPVQLERRRTNQSWAAFQSSVWLVFYLKTRQHKSHNNNFASPLFLATFLEVVCLWPVKTNTIYWKHLSAVLNEIYV